MRRVSRISEENGEFLSSDSFQLILFQPRMNNTASLEARLELDLADRTHKEEKGIAVETERFLARNINYAMKHDTIYRNKTGELN